MVRMLLLMPERYVEGGHAANSGLWRWIMNQTTNWTTFAVSAMAIPTLNPVVKTWREDLDALRRQDSHGQHVALLGELRALQRAFPEDKRVRTALAQSLVRVITITSDPEKLLLLLHDLRGLQQECPADEDVRTHETSCTRMTRRNELHEEVSRHGLSCHSPFCVIRIPAVFEVVKPALTRMLVEIRGM